MGSTSQGRGRATTVVGNIVVIVFIGALAALGIRTLVTQDTRFGWGMFSHQTNYALRYEWVYENGTTVQIADTADDLPGRQSIIRGDRDRSTRYGLGAVRRWVSTYLEYLYRERRPDGAVAVQARMVYVIDGARDDLRREDLRYPPNEGR